MSNEKNTQAELETLRLPELQARFLEVTGKASRSPNRTFLIRTIVEAVANGQIRVQQVEVPAEELPPTETVSAEVPVAPEEEVPSEPPAEHECEGCEVCEPSHGNEQGEASGAGVGAETKKRGRFSAMKLEELKAKYLEVVGRSTGSSDRGYLIWKIREAEKGRITVGPRQARTTEAATDDAKTLPLRLEGPAVSAMDTAWREKGIPSRTEFLRRAIGHYLIHLGATDAAGLFATK